MGARPSRPEAAMLDRKPPLVRLAVLATGTTVALLVTAAAASQPSQPARPKAAKPGADAKGTRAPAQEPAAQRQPAITDDTEDPAVWGREYPLEYETWKRTVDQKRTKYGGSEALPRTPDEADPRSTVSRSKLEEDPRLVTMWAGYAFSVDFREERGHAYMLEDQTFTKRQAVVKQPGACMQCHASVYVAYRKLGDGDLAEGFRKMNAMPYAEARALVRHPVACIDCHDPRTMGLRVTRPGFIAGMRELKASQGEKDYDVNAKATNQEMRAFVCGQCHVEYYFKGADKQLTYPWSKGLKVEDITAYYDEIQFKDWVHARTGAPALKAQHPEFELWSQGIHGRSGVSCVDCHMPEIRHRGETITDHQVSSPLLKIEASCSRCHRDVKPDELKARIEAEQDRFFKQRNVAMDALMALVADLEEASAARRGEKELEAARYLQRRAQFYLDFVEAENSTGFHAPQEALRILGDAVNYARQGQLVLRDPTFRPDVAIVSIPTAQPGPNQAIAPAPAPGARPPSGAGGR
jgi:nitrite reductase (cytochrome c-552)